MMEFSADWYFAQHRYCFGAISDTINMFVEKCNMVLYGGSNHWPFALDAKASILPM